MKRSRPSLALDKNKTPLIFALAQVRVAPIAQIEAFLPEIQETLRHRGFPQLLKRKYVVEQVPPNGEPTRQERVQWEMLNVTRTRSILIDEGSLVLQTSDYDTGENFLADLQTALEAFAQHAKPTDLLRVGLRYVDLIKPVGGLGLDDLVVPALRPQVVKLPWPSVTHLWESLRETGQNSKLLIRYTEAVRGFAFPPDLGPFISLRLKHDPKQTESFGLLDTDHFIEERAAFNVANTIKRADDLHDNLDQSFRELVTPDAINAWK